MRHLIIALLLGALNCSPSAAAGLYLSGRVVAKGTGKPVSGVTVSLMTVGDDHPVETAQSLGNGSFLLHPTRPGSYRLSVDPAPEYFPLERGVEVTQAGDASVELMVSPVPVLKVRVLDAAGNPAAGALLQAWVVASPGTKPDSTGSAAMQKADANGVIGLMPPRGAPLEDCHFGIAVRAPGRGFGQSTLGGWCAVPGAGEPETPPVEVALHPGFTLEGDLLDEAGQPVRGARVTVAGFCPSLAARFLQGGASVVTDAAGHFQADNLLPGKYQVEARISQDKMACREVVLAPGGAVIHLTSTDRQGPTAGFGAPFEDRPGAAHAVDAMKLPDSTLGALPAGASVIVSGRLLDKKTATPLPDLALMLYDKQSWIPYDAARTAADGSYTFHAPGPGKYTIAIYGEGYMPFDFIKDVPAEGLEKCDLSVSVRPELHLHIVRWDGLTMPAGTVNGFINVTSSTHGNGQGGTWTVGPGGEIKVQMPSSSLDPSEVTAITLRITDVVGGCGVLKLDHFPAEPIEFKLEHGVEVTGTAVDEGGAPIQQPNVYTSFTLLRPGPDGKLAPDYDYQFFSYTREGGMFRFPALIPGRYTVRMVLSNADERIHEVEIALPRAEVAVKAGKG